MKKKKTTICWILSVVINLTIIIVGFNKTKKLDWYCILPTIIILLSLIEIYFTLKFKKD